MSAPSPVVLDRKLSTWDQRLAKLAADPAKGLPELLGGAPTLIVAGRRRLWPYALRRDVSALMLWADQLRSHPSMGAVLSPVPGDPDATQILVAGTLLGEQVDLVVVTHREVPGPKSGTVRWEAVLEVAEAERKALLPELDDAELSPDALADPLMMTAGGVS